MAPLSLVVAMTTDSATSRRSRTTALLRQLRERKIQVPCDIVLPSGRILAKEARRWKHSCLLGDNPGVLVAREVPGVRMLQDAEAGVREIHGPWTPPQIQNEPGQEGTSSQGTQDMLPVLDLGDDDASQAHALAPQGDPVPVYRHERRRMEFQSGAAKRARVQEQSAEAIVELMRRLRDLRESGASWETVSDNLFVDASFRGLENTPEVTSTVEKELTHISLKARSPYDIAGDINFDPRLCHHVHTFCCACAFRCFRWK